eukprot:8101815-Pyramimonas_sp.AAC.1
MPEKRRISASRGGCLPWLMLGSSKKVTSFGNSPEKITDTCTGNNDAGVAGWLDYHPTGLVGQARDPFARSREPSIESENGRTEANRAAEPRHAVCNRFISKSSPQLISASLRTIETLGVLHKVVDFKHSGLFAVPSKPVRHAVTHCTTCYRILG